MSTVNNGNNKSCRGCLWFGECDSEERCDGFEPLDTYSVMKGEYEQALKERVEEYEEIVREFD